MSNVLFFFPLSFSLFMIEIIKSNRNAFERGTIFLLASFRCEHVCVCVCDGQEKMVADCVAKLIGANDGAIGQSCKVSCKLNRTILNLSSRASQIHSHDFCPFSAYFCVDKIWWSHANRLHALRSRTSARTRSEWTTNSDHRTTTKRKNKIKNEMRMWKIGRLMYLGEKWRALHVLCCGHAAKWCLCFVFLCVLNFYFFCHSVASGTQLQRFRAKKKESKHPKKFSLSACMEPIAFIFFIHRFDQFL